MTFYEYIKEFTEVYKENRKESAAIREARCVEVMSRYEFLPIGRDECVAGKLKIVPVGFSNEPLLGRSVGYFYDEARAMEALEKEGADEGQIREAKELLEYWKTQETRHQLRQSYPEDIAKAMPEDIYWEHSQVAFPLYRVVGAYLDYDKLLRLGLGGMKQEIRGFLEKTPAKNQGKGKAENPAKVPSEDLAKAPSKAEAAREGTSGFYQACGMALEMLSQVCLRYERQAREMQKEELADALGRIAQKPPETFLEALQLAWLYSLISGVLNYGRMDDYLGDYLERDLAAGRLTEEKALEYLCCLWRLIDFRKTVFHGRVIIGGRGRHNEAAADRFAMLAMEASRRVAEAEPQLSLRFYEGQNPELFQKALQVIGEGKIYPMLYNDDVNIPSVQKAFEVSKEEAEDYVFFGCGEYVLNKKSIGSPNGIINLLKALEVTIFGGQDIWEAKPLGLKLGTLADFETFEDLYSAYKKQLEHYFRVLARQEQLEYDKCGEIGEFLYISMLMEDCLEKGKGILGGGARYLGGTLETYGNINTSNSLYAIKDVVYDRKLISRETLMEALRADFAGYEKERKLLLEAEKYGNDLDGVDGMAIDLHEFVCRTVRELKSITRLHSYMVVIINNEANTILGRFTGASADGRKSGEPMANANNPAGGTDVCGATAMLNSLVKLRTDLHAGAVQNMTFSREMFAEGKAVAESLLRAYFQNGGQQAMINVLGRKDLLHAMERPEEYGHIMVRVGGFSARFVTLAPDVQREIASRTMY